MKKCHLTRYERWGVSVCLLKEPPVSIGGSPRRDSTLVLLVGGLSLYSSAPLKAVTNSCYGLRLGL
jgi:hypothetical protein